MRFWDSSALVPLIVEQAASKACRQLLQADRSMAVWWLGRTEIVSALQRLRRERALPLADLRTCEQRLDRLATSWTEVQPCEPVRDVAERVLRTHALRAADAVQLAASLVLFDLRPKGRAFVTLDRGLATAATQEGFDVVDLG